MPKELFIYRIDHHVVTFYKKRDRLGRKVFTTDPDMSFRTEAVNELRPLAEGTISSDFGQFGKFYVIVDFTDEDKLGYFNGEWGTQKRKWWQKKQFRIPQPLFTPDVHKAMFYLDAEAANETLAQITAHGVSKVAVQKIYLDYENTLPSQRFIIVCEDRKGKLSYLKDYDRRQKKAKTCRNSDSCLKLPFRPCLDLIETARSGCKDYRYSMLHDFGKNINAGRLLDYLKREKPDNRIALSFKLGNDEKK